MQLQWILFVTFSNSLAPGLLDYMPTPVLVATYQTREECEESKTGFLAMKKDKTVRDFFLDRVTDLPPHSARCLPLGTESQIRDYIAKHPEEAQKQAKSSKSSHRPND